MKVVLGIDPGREKCGVAAVSDTEGILWRAVVETARLGEEAVKIREQYRCALLVIGDGTTSVAARKTLEAALEGSVPIETVDEYRTTDAARVRYWRENPPRGWRRLLPVSMQVPPVPVDDYVAVILAERRLGRDR